MLRGLSPLDLLRFSAGALRGHRLRAGLTLLGVAIGVASVILLTSLGEGARAYVSGEFAALGTNLLIITPGKNETTGAMPMAGLGVPRDLTLEDMEALRRRVPQIRRIAPLAEGQVRARYGEAAREVLVAGTTAEMAPLRQIRMRLGQYLPAGEARGQRVCVIGSKLQEELFKGDNPIGEFLRLGDERFRVIGVWVPRGVSLGVDLDEVIHVPVAAAMRMYNQSGLFQVLAEVGSHEEIDTAQKAVVAVLKERHDGVEDVTVITQGSVIGSFTRILAVLTAALAGIAAVSLTVAGVGIMNVMLVSVSERTREVGLLKAVGVTRAQVVAAFLVEAAILSTCGGLVGLGAGYAGASMLRALYPAVPIAPPPWAAAGAVVVSISVGLVFGVLPARRAALLDPVAALARR
jgi:putative ABC transport system permease protein